MIVQVSTEEVYTKTGTMHIVRVPAIDVHVSAGQCFSWPLFSDKVPSARAKARKDRDDSELRGKNIYKTEMIAKEKHQEIPEIFRSSLSQMIWLLSSRTCIENYASGSAAFVCGRNELSQLLHFSRLNGRRFFSWQDSESRGHQMSRLVKEGS